MLVFWLLAPKLKLAWIQPTGCKAFKITGLIVGEIVHWEVMRHLCPVADGTGQPRDWFLCVDSHSHHHRCSNTAQFCVFQESFQLCGQILFRLGISINTLLILYSILKKEDSIVLDHNNFYTLSKTNKQKNKAATTTTTAAKAIGRLARELSWQNAWEAEFGFLVPTLKKAGHGSTQLQFQH